MCRLGGGCHRGKTDKSMPTLHCPSSKRVLQTKNETVQAVVFADVLRQHINRLTGLVFSLSHILCYLSLCSVPPDMLLLLSWAVICCSVVILGFSLSVI